ncbi:hypothetical protein [Plastoroseomonas arctica]|uniref:Uncharacterized protein n=1 Tax=Plastoroseomonas arctica TaxID=1509237 RepID=A0AAF1JXW7_9PROT|nr:hypothetical protein [Plastoroseomonas arctica]MBR0656506.1 hypothetical protein [Plastoroseomonas arctica]
MRFNHVANRLHPAQFETVVALFTEVLHFAILRRTERAIWLRQPGFNIDLQFSRSETPNRDADKLRSQIAFITHTPEADLQRLAAWLTERGCPASVGAYSPREFYLDAPSAFVDFVIEAMLPELADYPIPDTAP